MVQSKTRRCIHSRSAANTSEKSQAKIQICSSGLLLAQVVEELEQRDRAARTLGLRTAQQRDVAVELPAGEQDEALRSGRRAVELAVVVVRVDQQTELVDRLGAMKLAGRDREYAPLCSGS